MRLTLVNFFKKSVNGHIFRGKHRLVKQVTKPSMNMLMRDFEIQEENMLYLRNPYLTLEESSGHAKELGKKPALVQKWKEANLKMKPHVTLESRLSHLRVKENWD